MPADRKSERAEAHLGDFAGILQVDGYGGYAALARRQQIRLALCWAHVRRKFYELADSSPVAIEVLRRIAQLYVTEDEMRDEPAEQRRQVRNERRRVVVDDLHHFLQAPSRQVSAKAKLGKATPNRAKPSISAAARDHQQFVSEAFQRLSRRGRRANEKAQNLSRFTAIVGAGIEDLRAAA